mmetsp:Transcript_8172/g.15972  ORF Transcript_8172/g.15972 Transcript_8172/m.15972 type:complete len:110 (+) Transcript_8172:203-532(+)
MAMVPAWCGSNQGRAIAAVRAIANPPAATWHHRSTNISVDIPLEILAYTTALKATQYALDKKWKKLSNKFVAIDMPWPLTQTSFVEVHPIVTKSSTTTTLHAPRRGFSP